VTGALSTAARAITAKRVAQALALGVPLAMVASYLADQDAAGGDAGYYDDFVGDDGGAGDGGAGDGFDDNMGNGGTGGTGGVPPDLAPDELAWYLQSGNLPDRYALQQRSSRGRGKLQITHGDDEESESDEEMEGGAYGLLPQRGLMPIPKQRTKPKLPDYFYTRRVESGDMANERNMLEGMTQKQVDAYIAQKEKGLQTMNAPVSEGGRKAPKKADGRSARAEIVRKVMRERGVKMIEASKIVKAEGLY
jgi:hypothetical protein